MCSENALRGVSKTALTVTCVRGTTLTFSVVKCVVKLSSAGP